MKRAFDLTVSLIVLVFLIPIFIPIIILLKLTGEGVVFYLQNRVGWKNQPFKMVKFATMLKDSANMSTGTVTINNDPRVTKVGKVLRKTKINELPQVWNVVKGDLSLVGPRPLPQNEFKIFNTKTQKEIYTVRPGITGIASLIFRDEEGIIHKNNPDDPKSYYENIILPHKAELEDWYRKNLSIRTDGLIIILTLVSIFLPRHNFYSKFFLNLPTTPPNLLLK
jgi:lipopolysaccharide/colanic/teichoic acid biosynthesis glycosyltransferase